ncbi:MAG: hypothetical protein Q8K58_08835 [Acidimicrobiales bacterium]|nr:hypothetical protein [Acidimicrobiales bacterium]
MVSAAIALVASVCAWNGAAYGTSFPGVTGKLACWTRSQPTHILTMNQDGSQQTDISPGSSPFSDFDPLWTPDGRQIVVATGRIGQFSELVIMNADGTSVTPLVVNGSPDDRAKGFHQDGSQIVFQSNRDGNFEIYKMDADGTDPVRLTNSPGTDGLPDWSPDGTRIAFHTIRSGDFEIFTMDPFGGNIMRVTILPGEDSGPKWSPDGTRLAWQRNVGGNFEVFTANADGSDLRRLTNIAGSDFWPVWSPDGTKIFFTSTRDDPQGDVYSMNAADGSNVQRLTALPTFQGRCDVQRLCTIYGSGNIMGTEGNDVICGGPGVDRIAGLGGNDIILGLRGDDQILGGAGNDQVFGGTGNDSISGGEGVDFLSAGPDNDRIIADIGERIDRGAGSTDQCVIGGAAAACPPPLS